MEPGTVAIIRDTITGGTHIGLAKLNVWWSSAGQQTRLVWVVFGREIDYYPEEVQVLEELPGIEEKRREWERR